MNFSLLPGESPADSLRRIGAEQVSGAILQLEREDNLNDEIHEARKHFKRVRAVLRLARGALPAKTYRSENLFFRDQGRLLSPVRDSAVYIETLDRLRKRYDLQLAGSSTGRLKDTLTREHNGVLRSFAQDGRLRSIRESLREAQIRVQEWSIPSDDDLLFAAGLCRIYDRGRNEKMAAYAHPTNENFHAWRKRVKYLWHHFQILRPLWPTMMEALERDCDRLADRLGADHDLAVLCESPYFREFQSANREKANVLSSVIAQERDRLRRAAVLPAERIYVERSGRFVDRMKGYWLAFRPDSIPNSL